jgi:hypothetical protein
MASATTIPQKIKSSLRHQSNTIKGINEKYATPRMKLTRWGKIALLGIRIYLIIILCILLYKFITLIQ